MHLATGEVEHIAGLEHIFPDDLRGRGLSASILLDGERDGAAVAPPALPTVDLYQQHVVVVPMRLERAAPTEAQIGIDSDAMGEAPLERIGEPPDLRHQIVDTIYEKASSLRKQRMQR